MSWNKLLSPIEWSARARIVQISETTKPSYQHQNVDNHTRKVSTAPCSFWAHGTQKSQKVSPKRTKKQPPTPNLSRFSAARGGRKMYLLPKIYVFVLKLGTPVLVLCSFCAQIENTYLYGILLLNPILCSNAQIILIIFRKKNKK